MAARRRTVLIVGSGAAGVMTAQGLRRRGFEGRVAMIGAEPAHLYDRPPLSKQVLAGKWEPRKAVLMPAARIEGLEIEFREPAAAVALDLDRRVVTTADGAGHEYDELVIATGVTPRLAAWCDDGVHVLRTMDDATRLRAALDRGGRLAVVGAGFLGLEVAATARALGLEVTVVEPLAEPLAGRLTEPVASRLLGLHRRRGVEIRTGVGVSGRDGDRLLLSDGSSLAADLTLAAIGCVPAVGWLADSGLPIEDGVVCDDRCRAAPHVWAVGDVARWHHRRLGRSVRVEHRMNANDQGAAVAANILGADEPFIPIPFFWTDHYETKVQMWGVLPVGVEPEIAEGDLDDSFVLTVAAPRDGRVVGAIGWNAARSMPGYRAAIAATWDAAAERPEGALA